MYHPRADALRGSQHVHARQSNIALQVQSAASPLLVLAVSGGRALLPVGRRMTRPRR